MDQMFRLSNRTISTWGAPVWHPIRRITVLQKLLVCGASLHAVKITFLSHYLAVMSITHFKLNSFILNFLLESDLNLRVGVPFEQRRGKRLFCRTAIAGFPQ